MDLYCNPPIHPGEMLREDFMKPLGLTAGRVARDIGVPRTRIERLVREETGLSADTAVRLARYFRMTEGFWLGLQSRYETDCIHADAERLRQIEAINPLPRPDLEGLGDEAQDAAA